jgi:hypothetical protein
LDLFQYFTASCYSGFGDGPKVCVWRKAGCAREGEGDAACCRAAGKLLLGVQG